MVIKKIKKFMGLGPKFDKDMNTLWQGTFFSYMSLHPDHSIEQCVDAANRAVIEYKTTREVIKNA
jgi:hypothetical protein